MTNPLLPSALLGPLYSSAEMRAVVDDRARIQRMLDFESALVRALAAVGVVPASHAGHITEACRANLYDFSALAEGAIQAGNIATPLVKALTAEVARRSKKSSGFVHWGAASQDVIDTAMVLELRSAIDVLLTDLDRATKAFITLAGRNRRNMAVARTVLQQALPMPFGLKFAGYAAALARSRERLRRLRKEALVLQFGGAAGTLAALGEKGLDVSERLAALLDLTHPDGPWHSHRDRLAEVGSALAILAGTCGKIARDIALLSQTEVGEAFEAPAEGRGASSTLPHQRNPVAATTALSAAMLAPNLAATLLNAQMMQEHERAAGGWQSEWATFPALSLVVAGTLRTTVEIAEGLTVDVDRMKANLEATGGLVFAEAVLFALAPNMGRAEAHDHVAGLIQKAAQDKRSFKDIAAEDAKVKLNVTPPEFEKLFLANHYQGSAQTFIDRLVASSQGRTVRRVVTPFDPKMPASRGSEFVVKGAAKAGEALQSPVVAADPAPAVVKPADVKPTGEPFNDAVAAASALIAQTISDFSRPSSLPRANVAKTDPPTVAANMDATPAPAVETAASVEPPVSTAPEPVSQQEAAAQEAPATAAEPAPPAAPEPATAEPAPAVASAAPQDEPEEDAGALLEAFARAAQNENTPAEAEGERKPA